MTISDSKIVDVINNLSHVEMARLWRFAEAGNIYFNSTLPYYDIFMKRFIEFGGMTPKISKLIGWKENG